MCAKFVMPQIFVAPVAPAGHNPLSGLKRTLPQDEVERTFKPPTFNADGTVLYEKSTTQPDAVPDDISGYRRDIDNQFLFHPMWPPCAARFYGTKVKDNGCIEVAMACNHPDADTYRLPVDCATCKGCILRTQTMPDPPDPSCPRPVRERDFKQPVIQPDGRLVYEKTGWEPPVCPEGYHRDPKDMWAFIPEWQPCADRTFDNTVRPCGCITVLAKCNSDTSGYKGEKIPFIACQNCPVRREPGAPETYSIK